MRVLEIVTSFLKSETLVSIYPNIAFLMKVYTVLTLQSADCERGFSAMKRIKTAFRNRLSNKTLEQLMYISVNGPSLEKFDFQKAVSVWFYQRSRNISVQAQKTDVPDYSWVHRRETSLTICDCKVKTLCTLSSKKPCLGRLKPKFRSSKMM
eukprot:Pompholyxophrys_punicea_v1_NODE_204_length_2775_cov_14.624265.p2 type:complete len:152 gc:universal NODE_204_length_2775_cov_14.624265:1957-2412(+)